MHQSSQVTPPQSFRSSPPPTPPPTIKKTSPAVTHVIAGIKTRQSGQSLTEPWVAYSLKKDQYAELLQQIQDDENLRGYVNQELRHDYIPWARRLLLRMPTQLHEWIISSIVGELTRQLQAIAVGSNASADFARAVQARGSPTLDFTEAGYGRHDPDAQFRHLDAQYPGVVIEVSYSQKERDMPYIAEDYILGSDGDIQRVIVVKVGYPNNKKATWSVWEPRVVPNEAGEPELTAVQTVEDQIIRDEAGNPSYDAEAGLSLELRDFATEALVGHKRLTDSLRIPASTLYSYLTEAEKNVAKLNQKQGAVRETKPWVRKRRRQRTPPEELDDQREAKFRKIEDKAMAQADKDDSSYKTSSGGPSSPESSNWTTYQLSNLGLDRLSYAVHTSP